jgi:Bacterial transglutaminase-like cysteine proteinase BTLCP
MIAEILPEAYDAYGRQVSQPFLRRKGPHPTFPMGRYVSQPLTVRCQTMREVRTFLASCRYVSDKELFGKRDYWQPPEDFEKRKKGDCEDFALWTWRQLLNMGYDARFIGGSCGRYGEGHAWVEYFRDGKCYLVEPLLCRVGDAIPRLSAFRYDPRLSVSWDGKTLRYFSHKKPALRTGWGVLAPLVWEYLLFWAWFWLRIFVRLPQIAWKICRRRFFMVTSGSRDEDKASI